MIIIHLSLRKQEVELGKFLKPLFPSVSFEISFMRIKKKDILVMN